MKRLHVHVGVDDLDASVRFYSALFESEPGRQEADYARWLLDDPRVNFGQPQGVTERRRPSRYPGRRRA